MIGDLSKVWLVANVREEDAPLCTSAIRSRCACWPIPAGCSRRGLTYVAPSIDPNTHRLPVRAEVDNPDGALKPEMFASFRIITGADDDRARRAGRRGGL